MKLCELMVLGDDNAVGGLISDATAALKKLKKTANETEHSIIQELISTISNLNHDPNILQTDGYSLVQYLRMLTKPNVDKRTLQMVSDALDSYSEDSND